MTTAGLLLLPAVALAQAPGPDDAGKALERLKAAQDSKDSIPPELRALIINKPKIAEDTLQRAVGLREAGNPHIQQGDGLLLPGMKDVPELSHVDIEKLREERIAIYERKLEKQPPRRLPGSEPVAETNSLQAGAVESPAEATERLAARVNYGGLFLALSLLFAGVGAGMYVYQKGRKG